MWQEIRGSATWEKGKPVLQRLVLLWWASFVLFHSSGSGSGCYQICFQAVETNSSCSCLVLQHWYTVLYMAWNYVKERLLHAKINRRAGRLWNPVIREDILKLTVQITMQKMLKRLIFQETSAIQCWVSASILLSSYLCKALLRFFLPQILKAEWIVFCMCGVFFCMLFVRTMTRKSYQCRTSECGLSSPSLPLLMSTERDITIGNKVTSLASEVMHMEMIEKSYWWELLL